MCWIMFSTFEVICFELCFVFSAAVFELFILVIIIQNKLIRNKISKKKGFMNYKSKINKLLREKIRKNKQTRTKMRIDDGSYVSFSVL